MEGAAGEGVSLNHIAIESSDIKRLTKFYKEMFGFEEVETPNFGDNHFKIVWMSLPPSSSSSSFLLHLLQRVKNEEDEAPPSSSIVKDPSHVRTGQHLCFSISNFYSFLQTLKEKGIEIVETNNNIRRVFFYDPDGNGLEVVSF
ncbi:Lactoylglutathione lyase / glyoxalase I family protein [Trifolium repens]|nr:Lactoylglutathione lyase / glyoxalase I family protein [Trifolium repens]